METFCHAGITRRILLMSATLLGVLLLVSCTSDTVGEAVGDADTPSSTTSVPETTAPPQTASTAVTTSTTTPIPDDAFALGELVIVGVEFGEGGFIRVENRGVTDADVKGIYICQFPQYSDLGAQVPNGVIAAGDIFEVPAAAVGGLSKAGGEAALYANDNDFGSPDNILAFVQWGTGGARAEVATAANIWGGADVSVSPDPGFNDIVLNGDPADPEAWS